MLCAFFRGCGLSFCARVALAVLYAGGGVLLFPRQGLAVQDTWIAGNGLFITGQDWSNGVPPTSTDDAIFSSSNTYTVTIDASPTSHELIASNGNITFVSDSSNRSYELANPSSVGGSANLTLGTSAHVIQLKFDQLMGVQGSNAVAQLNVNAGNSIVAAGGIAIGTTGFPNGVGILNVSGANSSVAVTGPSPIFGDMTIGAGSNTTGLLNMINGGVFSTSAGVTTVNPTGAIEINGGTFNANGTLTFNGGTLTQTSASGSIFNQASAQTMNVQSGGKVNVYGTYGTPSNAVINVAGAGSQFNDTGPAFLQINNGGTLNVSAGGAVISQGLLGVGFSANGTMNIDGANSSLTVNSTSASFVGPSSTAALYFSNNAVGNIPGGFQIGASAQEPVSRDPVALVHLESGATVNTGPLFIAQGMFPAGYVREGAIDVYDNSTLNCGSISMNTTPVDQSSVSAGYVAVAGGTLNQSAASSLVLGSNSVGGSNAGVVYVGAELPGGVILPAVSGGAISPASAGNLAGGTFNSGTGGITINGNGQIWITDADQNGVTKSGTFNANCDIANNVLGNGGLDLIGGILDMHGHNINNVTEFNTNFDSGILQNVGQITGGVGLIKRSHSTPPDNAVLILDGVNTYTGPTTVHDGTLIFKTSYTTGSLIDVLDGATAQLAHNAAAPGSLVLETSAVNLNSSGTLDLMDNNLIVNYTGASPAGAIRSYIAAAYDNGAWDKPGLTSASAASDPNHLTALGYAEASDVGLASLDGQSISSNTLIVKYTYYGDSSLDGKVDLGNDFNLFLQGFVGTSGSSWVLGDYNYDGVTNTADFQLFLDGYKSQGGQLGALDSVIQSSQLLSVAQKAQLVSVVPEPASIVTAALAILFYGSRRRRASSRE
jgi:fibronectin-binding autotransporter adhesin